MPNAQTLQGAVAPCFERPSGTQGTLYLAAEVQRAGHVTNVVPSPGGALATEVSQCVATNLGRVRLAPPPNGSASILLFVVSSCSQSTS